MEKLHVQVTENDHAQGDANAAVTLVEYGDYECPACGDAYPIVKQVQQHFGKRLRFVFRNFPLTEMHPNAEPAAEAAEAAGVQGRFWEMHDALYKNQQKLDPAMLPGLAASLGLDAAKVEAAVGERQFADRIEADLEGGTQSGVQGTPSFFINGKLHGGSYALEELVRAIEAA